MAFPPRGNGRPVDSCHHWPKINHAVQSDFGEKELALMDQQAGFDFLGLHGAENFVEGHHHRLDVRLEKLQREIGSGPFARYGDFAAGKFRFLDRMR